MAPQRVRRTPTQERSKALVEAVLDATARVLVEEGYDTASTNRIAKRAGVSVGSLYQYFPDKRACVEALAERHLERELATVLEGFVAYANQPIDVLTRALVEALVAAHRVDPELHRVLVSQTPTDVAASLRTRIEAVLRADMERRAAAGENRILDADVAAYVVVAAVDGAILGALERRPDLLQDNRLVDALTDLVLRYCLPVHDPD
ncbi:MAG: AcrR family transcriptional regulator [Myxococcota bacterium]|jgi:AcrR family transcriptional regulator